MSEVESINPNTPVVENTNTEGKLEINSGAGPVSFEELEEVTKKAKVAKKQKAEKSEDDGEEKPQKSKDLTSDTDKGKKPEPKAEKKPVKEPEEGEESKEGDTDLKALRKKIKAKLDDSEFELDEEAMIPVKINGKEEFVQVKDLMGNYSGKVAWDKKFSEIDQTRKQIAAKELKVRQIEDMIKSVYEEQDPQLKMFRMAQLAGVDPVQFRQKFFDEQISMLEKYYSMSEDERKADALAYEASIHKHRADTLESEIKSKQDYESLQTKVSELRERHQVSEREFVDAYDRLENLVRAGQVDPKAVTPEYIMQTIEVDRLWSSAADKLDSLGLDWNDQTRNENLQKLVRNAHQLGLKPADMAEMVDELWGVKKAQKKIEEKRKANQEFLSGKKEVPQVKPKSDGAVFFDEI